MPKEEKKVSIVKDSLDFSLQRRSNFRFSAPRPTLGDPGDRREV